MLTSAMIYAKAERAKILCTYTLRVCPNVPVWLAAGVGRNFRGSVTITAPRMLHRSLGYGIARASRIYSASDSLHSSRRRRD